jgi:ankyrin repeat protein
MGHNNSKRKPSLTDETSSKQDCAKMTICIQNSSINAGKILKESLRKNPQTIFLSGKEHQDTYRDLTQHIKETTNQNPDEIYHLIINTHGNREAQIKIANELVYFPNFFRDAGLQNKNAIINIFSCNTGFGLQPKEKKPKAKTIHHVKYKKAMGNDNLLAIHSNKRTTITDQNNLQIANLIDHSQNSFFEQMLAQMLFPQTFKVLVKDQKGNLIVHKYKRMPVDENVSPEVLRLYLLQEMEKWADFYEQQNLSRFETTQVDISKTLAKYRRMIGVVNEGDSVLTNEEKYQAKKLTERYFNTDFFKTIFLENLDLEKRQRRADIYLNKSKELNLFPYPFPELPNNQRKVTTLNTQFFDTTQQNRLMLEITQDGSTQFFKACQNGNFEVAESLISNFAREDNLLEKYHFEDLPTEINKDVVDITEFFRDGELKHNWKKIIEAKQYIKLDVRGKEKIFKIEETINSLILGDLRLINNEQAVEGLLFGKEVLQKTNNDGLNCLDVALKENHLSIVDLLIEQQDKIGLTITEAQQQKIFSLDVKEVCYLGLVRILDIFYKHNKLTDIDNKMQQEIVLAACSGFKVLNNSNTLYGLSENGFSFDFADPKTGKTPLIVFMQNDYGKYGDLKNTLKMLSTCPIDHQDIGGNSAMHYACKNFNLKNFMGLIELGANISLVNKEGQTPLHTLLSQHKNIESYKVDFIYQITIELLKNKANPDCNFEATDKDGNKIQISFLAKLMLFDFEKQQLKEITKISLPKISQESLDSLKKEVLMLGIEDKKINILEELVADYQSQPSSSTARPTAGEVFNQNAHSK